MRFLRPFLLLVPPLILCGLILPGSSLLRGQSPTDKSSVSQSAIPQWQMDAGGKMAFDVASVKQSVPRPEGYRQNFPLTLGASNFASVGSLMSVDVPLRTIIGFAFKLSVGQTRFLMPGLPDWVDSKWFDIEARAPMNNPTKDQFRLMVQSLLADRFKLTMHNEERRVPIYELVLSKSGRTGPQLRSHIDDVTCGAESRADAPPAPADLSPFPCGAILIGSSPLIGRSGVTGQVRGGGREVSLDYIAAFLTGTAFKGVTLDRPVVNATGLSGNYDFWIDFAPDANFSPDRIRPDPNGPTFPEALADQLGLKLRAVTEPVDVRVVDHIEEPSPN